MSKPSLCRRRFVTGAAAAGLAGAFATARAERGNPRMMSAGQSIDALVADFMAGHDVPGMALAIVQAPYITRATGYGLADRDRRLLVAANTLFDLGEMAEAYTNVAIMQLVEAGRLDLDSPVGTWLPSLPASWRPILLRHVLLRTSGIPAAINEATGHGAPLAFAAGSSFAASGGDHALLVALIEAVAREEGGYRGFIRRHQIERLGLRHTVFAAEAASIRSEAVENQGNRHRLFLSDPALINPPERATGYRADNSAAPAGTSALLASATDVSVWDIGLAGGILVKTPALRAMLYAPTPVDSGRMVPAMSRWQFPGRPGLMYIAGNANGQSAFLSRFTAPTELVCVTLLANKEGLDLTQLGRRIAGAYDRALGPPVVDGCIGLQQSPWPAAETRQRLETLARVEGVELARAGLEPRAWEQDGQTWVCLSGPAPAQTSQKVVLNRLLLRAVTP